MYKNAWAVHTTLSVHMIKQYLKPTHLLEIPRQFRNAQHATFALAPSVVRVGLRDQNNDGISVLCLFDCSGGEHPSTSGNIQSTWGNIQSILRNVQSTLRNIQCKTQHSAGSQDPTLRTSHQLVVVAVRSPSRWTPNNGVSTKLRHRGWRIQPSVEWSVRYQLPNLAILFRLFFLQRHRSRQPLV